MSRLWQRIPYANYLDTATLCLHPPAFKMPDALLENDVRQFGRHRFDAGLSIAGTKWLHDGSVYACDHFVDPTHRTGNIETSPLGTPVQRRVALCKSRSYPAALHRVCNA